MSEDDEQKKVVGYLKILERQGKIITFFAPVNENKQSKTNKLMAIRLANKAKLVGKRAGVSDLVIIFKDKVLFLEMKVAPKVLKSGKLSYSNSKVSENQTLFLDKVSESFVCISDIAYGWYNAKEIIDNQIKDSKSIRNWKELR
tara:strand:+ start:415 stop:846 length:432 start_codon:yes stop_codon:yes gene_type:complete